MDNWREEILITLFFIGFYWITFKVLNLPPEGPIPELEPFFKKFFVSYNPITDTYYVKIGYRNYSWYDNSDLDKVLTDFFYEFDPHKSSFYDYDPVYDTYKLKVFRTKCR